MRRGSVGDSQSRRNAESGLTLIEMLVALAVFALLGVMGYRAAATAMDTRQRVAAELQRWRDIANFVQIIESDLTQFVDRPGNVGAAGAATSGGLLLRQTGGNSELSFVKLDGGGATVRRRGYRLDGQRLVQLRWPGTDTVSMPEAHPILDRVAALRCTVLAADGQQYPAWPDAKGGRQVKPAAIDVELEIADVGTIRRLVALR
ncbi:MAG: type II secretion system minor pseudopilin GspJ [Rhodocyclales bacterium]|nr:type II secretion system minor pseudopilin GspJ [Rhodocyclales bacterium]